MRTSDATLVKALEARNDPRLAPILSRARRGFYNEFFGVPATPLITLVQDLWRAGGVDFDDLVNRVRDGDFDATLEEGEEWEKSPEGQKAFKELTTLGIARPHPR